MSQVGCDTLCPIAGQPRNQETEATYLSARNLLMPKTFGSDVRKLKHFLRAKKEKALLQLNPQTDKYGILRVNGRLQCADDLPYDARHPILMPGHHPITKLLIRSKREKLGHGTGVEHLLCELRTRFWVPKVRRTVRSTVETFPGCHRRFTAKPAGQIMAPLPKSRVTPSLRAFERFGVDFGGPYLTKQ